MNPSELIRCLDASGEEFHITLCGERDLSSLLAMYSTFSPRPASQGLPPQDVEICADWVKGLLATGVNLIACKGKVVIGHAALLPDKKGEHAEFVIFVHQSFRNLGIGTQLGRVCLERAKQTGYLSVWLTVALSNFIAIKLYKNLCFDYCDMDECERTMVIRF